MEAGLPPHGIVTDGMKPKGRSGAHLKLLEPSYDVNPQLFSNRPLPWGQAASPATPPARAATSSRHGLRGCGERANAAESVVGFLSRFFSPCPLAAVREATGFRPGQAAGVRAFSGAAPLWVQTVSTSSLYPLRLKGIISCRSF